MIPWPSVANKQHLFYFCSGSAPRSLNRVMSMLVIHTKALQEIVHATRCRENARDAMRGGGAMFVSSLLCCVVSGVEPELS